MHTYKIYCYIPGTSISTEITCREMLIQGGAYTFWRGEYGATNELIASYPVMYTIIQNTKESHDE